MYKLEDGHMEVCKVFSVYMSAEKLIKHNVCDSLEFDLYLNLLFSVEVIMVEVNMACSSVWMLLYAELSLLTT